MSVNSEIGSHDGFDAADHQTAYIYTPGHAIDDAPKRPTKKRKLSKPRASAVSQRECKPTSGWDSLLGGCEDVASVNLRQELFRKCWGKTESQIQSVLDEANEGTLAEVALFVHSARDALSETLPAGFIVTGPNIASQDLLFKQLSTRLKSSVNGSVVVLRSGDVSNLKSALKQIIRDATKQKSDLEKEEEDSTIYTDADGRKLLNYDLEILHTYVQAKGSHTVLIAFQDSEAFDTNLLSELLSIFKSWKDRIPFVLLFGIATSVDLFQERLPKSVSKYIHGTRFDVEQTRTVLRRIFQRAVVGSNISLRLGANLVSSLIDRQDNHVQSIQSFTTALKYAYMCHFYGNPLSLLIDILNQPKPLAALLQPEHLEAIRMLPSFRNLVENLRIGGRLSHARRLMMEDKVLIEEIQQYIDSRHDDVDQILATIHLLSSLSTGSVDIIELYREVFLGSVMKSDQVIQLLESTKKMSPDDILVFIAKLRRLVEKGCPENELEGNDEDESIAQLTKIETTIIALMNEAKKTGKPLRSKHATHTKTKRITTIAKKIQLADDESAISDADEQFASIIEQLSAVLTTLLNCPDPQELFLHEVWLYDELIPYDPVFTPQPRHAIESALSNPADQLGCKCCKDEDGIFPTQPATAIIYQMYLEAGSLINVSDLWSAFVDNQNPNDDDEFDERESLMLFYRALSDLRLLGMLKQSKKKADHLSKIAWRGI